MTAAEFAKRRGKLEREPGRSSQWKTRALAKLVQQAGALPVIIERRHVSWRLPDGQTVCVKTRHQDRERAEASIKMIAMVGGTHDKPQRAYQCPFCQGWHLTSDLFHSH